MSSCKGICSAVVLGAACLLGSVAVVEGAETARASVHTSGSQSQLGNSNEAMVSATGRFLVFSSSAWSLAADDNGRQHIYLRDRATPLTERVSISSAGVAGNQGSLLSSVSADGRFVVYQSQATNLVTPATTFARFHVFMRDRQAGTTVLVSAAAAGVEGNLHSYSPTITPDGRYVAFESAATNLTDPPTNSWRQILRWDRTTGETIVVSLHEDGSQATASCYHPSISDDGNRVAFHSFAALDAGFPGGNQAVYVRDIASATTQLASVGWNGTAGNSHCGNPALSGDGQHVAFESSASNLVDGTWNGRPHIYVRDLSAGVIERMSENQAGVQGEYYSQHPAINADGTAIAFESASGNLVPDDANGSADIFVRRRGPSAGIERVSVRDASVLGPGDPQDGNGWCWNPAIDAAGWNVAFESWSSDLVADDTNGFADIFLRHLDPPWLGVPPASLGDVRGLALGAWPHPAIAGAGVRLHYTLPARGPMRLAIYDAAGRSVRLLAEGVRDAGPGSLRWDGLDARGRRAPAGVYLARLEAEQGGRSTKLVLLP